MSSFSGTMKIATRMLLAALGLALAPPCMLFVLLVTVAHWATNDCPEWQAALYPARVWWYRFVLGREVPVLLEFDGVDDTYTLDPAALSAINGGSDRFTVVHAREASDVE